MVLTGIAKQMACSGLWRDWPTIGQSAKCQVRAQNCPAHCIYTLKKINCTDCRHDDLPSPCNSDPLLGPTALALAANCSSRPLTARQGATLPCCPNWARCLTWPSSTRARGLWTASRRSPCRPGPSHCSCASTGAPARSEAG